MLFNIFKNCKKEVCLEEGEVAVIMIGKSGCGKGTQGERIKKLLEEKYNKKIFYLGTGSYFREFIKGDGLVNKLSKNAMETGGLQPEFLTIWIWANALVNGLTGNTSIIADGTPRKLHEAQVFDDALNFLKIKNKIVIHVDVGLAWATERLLERKREDDGKEKIEKRLAWFESEVRPTLEYYRENKSYKFIEINGEQTIEEVWSDILKSVEK